MIKVEKLVDTNIVFLLERFLRYWKRRMEQRKINIQRKENLYITTTCDVSL